MKELVLFVARGLADKPDAVSVTEVRDGNVLSLRVAVDEADKGKLIGRQGKVVKALRALVDAASRNTGARAVVEID